MQIGHATRSVVQVLRIFRETELHVNGQAICGVMFKPLRIMKAITIMIRDETGKALALSEAKLLSTFLRCCW